MGKDGKLIQKLMIDEKRCYLFGRNSQLNDFTIDHNSCSRVHAALVYHKHLHRCFGGSWKHPWNIYWQHFTRKTQTNSVTSRFSIPFRSLNPSVHNQRTPTGWPASNYGRIRKILLVRYRWM